VLRAQTGECGLALTHPFVLLLDYLLWRARGEAAVGKLGLGFF
jgi:hypothetical protein